MNKGVGLLFLVLACFALQVQPAHATAIGVHKAVMSFNNVLKNGYAEDAVYVTTDSEDNMSLTYEFSGDIAAWASVKETGDMYLYKGRGQWVTVIITPPADTPNGIYTGIVRVRTGPLPRGDIEGRLGSKILASFAVQIMVEVIGEEIRKCVPGGYTLPDLEEGKPLDLSLFVQNSGNVVLTPLVLLKIWDQEQDRLIFSKEIPLREGVLPTTSRQYYAQVPELSLPLGQYWAEVSVPMCEREPELVTFSVVEKGAVSDEGTLLRIDNPYWANVGDIVAIKAVFKNLGKRVVSAKFKGKILKDQAVVKVIDTDFMDVEPGLPAELEAFFQPEDPGTYEIVGRVLYNNKLTYEKNSVLNVNPTEDYLEKQRQRITLLSYAQLLVLLLAIIFLILLIRRKRKQRSRRIIRR